LIYLNYIKENYEIKISVKVIIKRNYVKVVSLGIFWKAYLL